MTGGPALWGEPVTVAYTIDNRGGADAGAFDVELRLSRDNQIDAADTLVTTVHLAGLAAGSGNGKDHHSLSARGAREAAEFFHGARTGLSGFAD